MLLLEFYESATTPFQDVSQDHSQPEWGQSRKTRLTLEAINKIRRMKEVQAYERAKSLDKIRKQYAPPAAPAM